MLVEGCVTGVKLDQEGCMFVWHMVDDLSEVLRWKGGVDVFELFPLFQFTHNHSSSDLECLL